MKHVVFVCTGNICRSPIAEALFRDAVKGRRDIEVSSAGVSAADGLPASEHSAQVLRPWGLSLANFRSRMLTEEIVKQATHIFVMTRGHLDSVRSFFPEAAEKAFLLREFDDTVHHGNPDVPDPIGLSVHAYFETRDLISRAIPSLLHYLDHTDSMTPPLPAPTVAAPATSTRPLRIALGADHGGVELRAAVHATLSKKGYVVADFGAFSHESVDYPDFAEKVCRNLIADESDFGVLICKSGIGMSIAANRFPQIRAALVTSAEEARITRQHNHANVLVLGQNHLTPAQVGPVLDAFFNTAAEGGRHERRVEKLELLGTSNASHPSLAEADPEIAHAVKCEKQRQFEHLELIASENFTSRAVMEAQGSCLTNKYAEGYPGRRWYGGCEQVDVVEQLAIDRARQLFGGDHVNVQPHSGSQANTAVYFSALQLGDRILTMDLSHGGHLTHGHKANFSGRFYEVVHYGVSRENERIDYDALARQALEVKPKMITAGASAYPRIIDFPRLREIADSVGALLFVDMAHIAGLVAAGLHPNPVPLADYVTTTTHKSLRGPRGGLIICKAQYAKAIDSQVFPGIQGGPLMHVIAAKAVCLHEALQPAFKTYAAQVVSNAKALAAGLAKNGFRITSGGTDNHLMLVDLRPAGLNGKVAQETLDQAGITVNKNGIPFDTEPISKGGGIRVGTPAVTTRGMKEEEMMEIADLIYEALQKRESAADLAAIRDKVRTVTRRYPLPG